MKKIKLNQLSRKLQDSIIKEVKGAKYIAYEEEKMSTSKAPDWFQSFEQSFKKFEDRFNKFEDRFNQFEDRFNKFEKNQLAFNKEVLERLDKIENTPTMRKELQG